MNENCESSREAFLLIAKQSKKVIALATLPVDYVMMTISIPGDIIIKKLIPSDLPNEWNAFPHPASTQVIGDKFVAEGQYCLL